MKKLLLGMVILFNITIYAQHNFISQDILGVWKYKNDYIAITQNINDKLRILHISWENKETIKEASVFIGEHRVLTNMENYDQRSRFRAAYTLVNKNTLKKEIYYRYLPKKVIKVLIYKRQKLINK